MRFDKLAERQILKAQAEGQLDDLSGAGKPLNREEGPTDEAAGYRIMARSGALPEEIVLKKALDEARAALANATGAARREAMAKVADLEMRHAITVEARRAFARHN